MWLKKDGMEFNVFEVSKSPVERSGTMKVAVDRRHGGEFGAPLSTGWLEPSSWDFQGP